MLSRLRFAQAALALSAFVILASVFLTAPSEARDRPGTPNGGRTDYCGSILEEPPKMCVEFQNTAKEPVGFLLDWTENGRAMPTNLSGRAECRDRSAQFYYCTALQKWFLGYSDINPPDRLEDAINPNTSSKFIRDREFPEGFRVTNLSYDSEYCFRFRAVDKFGVVSGSWSGYTCARTPSPPEEPNAPARPQLTAIQPTTGKGEVGSATPFRLLVEWPSPTSGEGRIGWYTIQLWKDKRWIEQPGRINARSNKYEGFVDFQDNAEWEKRQGVRVCAHNILHSACSPETLYYGRFAPPRQQTEAEVYTGRRVLQGRETTTSGGGAATRAASGRQVLTVAQQEALAVRGEALANQDPLAAELRDQQLNGPARRGFDIGMAIAEGETAPGPGKQRIHDSLPADEQAGYRAAVAFSLVRNRHAGLATTGAAIAESDPLVAEARAAEDDIFYRLGFDIATGLFGDPAQGATGSKVLGTGALRIRDGLDAVGRRGFDASVKFHLGRDYQ